MLHGDQFGNDADGDFLRGDGANVEADRRVHRPERFGRGALFKKRVEDAPHFGFAADQPDVAHRIGDDGSKRVEVVRVSPRDDHGIRRRRQLIVLQPGRNVLDDDVDALAESFLAGELLAVVDDVDAEAGVVRHAGDVVTHVSGAEDEESRIVVDHFHVELHDPAAGGKLPPLLERDLDETACQAPDAAAEFGLAVSALQMLQVYVTVANGGMYKPPRLVEATIDADGQRRELPAAEGRRVISPDTAGKLSSMLTQVVSTGTGTNAAVPGYHAAGKTGTARKPLPGGGYQDAQGYHYIATFAGFVPAERPELSIIVVIDEPVGRYHGGEVAAPVFKRVADQVLRYLAAPPDAPGYTPRYTHQEERPEPPRRPVPEFPPQPPQPAYIPASAPAVAGSYGGPERPFGGVRVPDFYGKPLREVTEEALRMGLRLQSAGSGVAVEQSPPPGAGVSAGSSVQVRFSTRP